MPTNLPPEYFDAEKRYKAAESDLERIAALEEMLSKIPKHKGTDKLRADYRRRLSKLKISAKSKKQTGKRNSAFRVPREGPGQVVVVGFSNVGKSALVARLTNATPEVADTPFTTWQPSPGMMPVENVQIQLVDTPPLDRDYLEPELFDLIRRADIILLVVDLQTYPLQQLEGTVVVLREHLIAPKHLEAADSDGSGLVYVPLLVLVNKCDGDGCDEVFEVFCELLEGDWPLLAVSVETGYNLEALKHYIFEQLDIVRIYSKMPGKEPDLETPFVMRGKPTLEEFASKIHHDFYTNLKSARVWGSTTFDGQQVNRDYVLQDGDVVELKI
jgi:hypothetical protein